MALSERRITRPSRKLVSMWVIALLVLPACVSPSRSDLPNVGPFAPEHALPQAHNGPAGMSRSPIMVTTGARDYTAAVALEGLSSSTSYRYRVLTGSSNGQEVLELRATGTFRTAAATHQPESIRVAWSGDLGGQQHCRKSSEGYAIFERMRAAEPTVALLLGDLIYADDRCTVP